MNFPQLAVLTLVVGMTTFASVVSNDYSPCTYGSGSSYDYAIDCTDVSGSEMLNAFRRNKDNTNINGLHFSKINDDNIDDILAEIIEIVASTAGDRVHKLAFFRIPKLTKVPRAVRKLRYLNFVSFDQNEALKILTSGSLSVSARMAPNVYFTYNPDLYQIERGTFQGNLNGSFIGLWQNNLNRIDEAIFKPLLSGSTAEIDLSENPFVCNSCSLAWLIRDNRQYLPRIHAECKDSNGITIDIADADPTLLSDC